MPEKKSRARHADPSPNMRREPFHQLEEPGSNWLDRLSWFDSHFGRFVRDAAGVILLAFGLMTVLALTGWNQESQGARETLLSLWAGMLTLWFGWGSFLVAISFGYVGLIILRRNQGAFSLGRFIAFELVLLLTLSLLAIIDSGHRRWVSARRGAGSE